MSDPDPSGARSITILRCAERGRIATKTWRRVHPNAVPELVQFKAGTKFRVERRTVANIHELSALLTALERDTRALVIRGEPLPGVDLSQPVDRLKHAKKNRPACFRDAEGGLHWVLADFDKVRLPAGLDPVTEPEETVRWLIDLLPTNSGASRFTGNCRQALAWGTRTSSRHTFGSIGSICPGPSRARN